MSRCGDCDLFWSCIINLEHNMEADPMDEYGCDAMEPTISEKMTELCKEPNPNDGR